MFIYKITNLINGKCYIGQTTRNIKERWNSHCYRKDSKSIINFAINKYGKNNFKLEILEKTTINKLDKKEIYWINKLNTMAPNGYNLESGGNKFKKASKVLRKKLSLAKLGKKYGPRKQGTGDNICLGKGCKPFKVYSKLNNEFIGKWLNRSKCAADLQLNRAHIASCLRGERLSHKGYIFIGDSNG